MKASELAERRKQIEESLQRNEINKQNFLERNPQYFNESGISSSELSESISSSRLQNDSDIFQQKAQKFNTGQGGINGSYRIRNNNKQGDFQDNDESIHELIEEHIQNKNEKPLSLDSSSELEYSQSHQMQRKGNNSILKKQFMNNSSGIEEFSFQNNFGMDNSNVKISNIFNNNNNNGNNANSAHNLQQILKSDNQNVSNINFYDDSTNFGAYQGDNKNFRNNQYPTYSRDSDLQQGSLRESQSGLHRIEEEKNSQQNFYSNQFNLTNQTQNNHHQYQLSSSSSRKGAPNNDLITSSHQNFGNKASFPIYSHNSNNSENINILNYSNSNQQFRQPQWSLSQSIYHQQPSVQYAQPVSINDNSYQSSLHLQNNLQNNNSSIANSSSVRAHYPFNQQQQTSSMSKDYDFFRINREKREVELPSDMRQQYEKIYEIQTSPNKNEIVSKMRQPSPYQQYSQYLYEKQQEQLSYQNQLKEQQTSLQNSERRENYRNSLKSNDQSVLIKNSAEKSPSRQERSMLKKTDQFETQRNKFQQVLENHVRKFSPHTRTQAEFENSLKEELKNSRSFQIGHLQDIYNSYKFDESLSSSSISSEESMQQSMAHSVKLKIQKEIARQKGIDLDEEKRLHDQKMLQQYISNQSDRSNNSNPQFVNQLEQDLELMKTQVVPQSKIIDESNEEDQNDDEEISEHENDNSINKQDNQNEDNQHYHEEEDEEEGEQHSHDKEENEFDEEEQQFNQQDQNENKIYEEEQQEEEENQHKQEDQIDQQQNSQVLQSEEGSLINISQQNFRYKKNSNKHPTLYQINNILDNEDPQNNKPYQKRSSMADFSKYQGKEIDPKEWNKYNQQRLEEEQDQKGMQEDEEDDDNNQNLRDEDEEQPFQQQFLQTQEEFPIENKNDYHQSEGQFNDEDDFHQLNEEELEQLTRLDEDQILESIEELYRAVSLEKDKEEDEERKHQYELILIRLMNLIPQESYHKEDLNERNKQLSERIEELMDIQKLFIEILISKKGEKLARDDSLNDIPPQDYEADIKNLLLQLKKLDQKLQQIANQRSRRLSKAGLLSKRQSNADSKLNFDPNDHQNINNDDIFDQSRKNSNTNKSMMELGDFIQKQNQEYLKNEEEFMNRLNQDFDNDQQQEINQQDQNENQSVKGSQQEIQQPQRFSDNEKEDNEDEEEDNLTHNDLLQMLDKKYSQNNSHDNLPPIGSKQKIQENQNSLSKISVENEEFEKELTQIRKNAQLKKEILDMLHDKSGIIEKFKYRLEMRLNNKDENNGQGKKSALDDVDLSFQSEMKYEDSLKYSSLYKDKSKKQQNPYRKPSDDNNSERSAPALMNNQDDNQEDHEKSELDKTLQDKLKHELFLDLENFRRSDIFKNLYSRKINDLIQAYVRFNLSKQIKAICRGMNVMANAKIMYQKKEDKLKQNCFNVIKWYSDYQKVKNNRKFQIQQSLKVKNYEIKSIAFAKIKKFCMQHRKWMEAIQENNKMMKCYKVFTEWKKIVNYKAMKKQADLYYKDTLFQKFKNKINEKKNSVDVIALMHYSTKLTNQFFTLFCKTAQEQRRKRIAIEQKVSKINNELIAITFQGWRKYAKAKKQEKNDYISIQICIKDTISKPKMQPNQTLQDYKRTPITTQKTIKVIMPPDSVFKS